MIRVLLALDGALMRGSLAFVLSAEPDIEVVAEVRTADRIGPAVYAVRPDVAVVDLAVYGADGPPQCAGPCELPAPVLVLAAARRVAQLRRALVQQTSTVGFLSDDVAPERVVDGIRRLARDEPVADADLVVEALTTRIPFTARELQVLEIAAEGHPVVEIAARLALSPGTVRNHLSRVTTKAGARTRIEAVRIARDAGWIS
ncbi:response regulator transcription factor [Solwaraspora sp. WMMD406]|uniref:response regulator transcription factor n=1 Tax=Solwaraspora sp. WMMD406 TaxID=3016095 RepID=UPI00241671F0|nr:response regulator transcription factor [Solwaraspora sp. WMMD406]MDG4766098.1 response regulator transcription factor [Solwaraspora sp. WMMD406]